MVITLSRKKKKRERERESNAQVNSISRDNKLCGFQVLDYKKCHHGAVPRKWGMWTCNLGES